MALLLFVITIKMATIDIIILAMIGVGVIMGLIKGFVKQMASIVGLIAGLLMARALFGIVAERLAPVPCYPYRPAARAHPARNTGAPCGW